MILVDTALEKRHQDCNPIRVAMVGAGYIGRGIALQIVSTIKGMRLAAISNRTISEAEKAYSSAGVDSVTVVKTAAQLESAVADDQYAITDDPSILCEAQNIDAVIDATGEVEFGAQVAVKAIENGKHIVMSAELDATVGPILKVYADRAGVIITNTDGDQPGVLMNLFRFVKTIGYQPVLAGNIKGFLNHYSNPDTQREFAASVKQKPRLNTSFADGTKISLEMAVVANATGFKVGKRGMYGPKCKHVSEALKLFPMDKMLNGGLVDYIIGADPSPGVFVIGHNDTPVRREYMKYFKMGDGPLYIFYTPCHLTHLELPLTVARAVLFNDATIAPIGGPICDVISVAKRDLKAGEILDGLGGFTCYGVIENSDLCRSEKMLHIGLSQGCRLTKDIHKDSIIAEDDVDKPLGRMIDKLRAEQNVYFS